MFNIVTPAYTKDITCTKTSDLEVGDFRWYDKDGFELCPAEKKLYTEMDFPLTECLYHLCWQDTWLTTDHPNFLIDHAMLLHRCDFDSAAKEQIQSFTSKNPIAQLLLRSKKKWGFDFALDYIDDNQTIWEVVHIEWDSYNFNEVVDMTDSILEKILSSDWEDISSYIIKNKDEWSNLEGYRQNDWKAQQIFGWSLCERTLKSI